MKVIGDNIFVTQAKKEEGIIMGGDDLEVTRYTNGVIVHIGSLATTDVKVGDEIYYQKNAGYPIIIQGDSFLVLCSADVVLIV